ncbi:MAG: mechanosensitive ion channel domain-containing protein, partial [Ignavibacteria bacterium]
MKEFFNYTLLDTGGYRLTVGMLIAAISIIAIAKILVLTIQYVFGKRTKSFPENEERLYSILTLITYIIWVIAFALMLENLGIKVTFLIAGSAALLVGLGLGLQQTFNDIVSGIIILVEGSLKKNDVVEVDKLVGRVKEINLRTSVIYTRDSIDMIVPNHKFINENVINWSHHS